VKIIATQIEKRLDERFASQEKAREDTRVHWDAKFAALEKAASEEAKQWQRIDRDLLELKATLPVDYVRRDDYIRNQTIIEAKLDGLALQIQNALLTGKGNG
jgi:transketolase